jgi:hypothetical protein
MFSLGPSALLMLSHLRLAPFLCIYSVSKSFVSRREAAGSAVARQGEATTTRMI